MSENRIFPVSLVSGIPAELRPAALNLFWTAFSRKLRIALGPQEKALRFLARCIVAEQATCAIDAAGQLVGFAAIKSDQLAFIHPTLATFSDEYGIPGGMIRALIINQLDAKPTENEIMIESLCVSESVRGLGIGQLLLSQIKQLAHLQRKNIILDVIAENKGARRLYTRAGFYEIGQKTLFFSAPLFGFRQVIRMQFNIDMPDLKPILTTH